MKEFRKKETKRKKERKKEKKRKKKEREDSSCFLEIISIAIISNMTGSPGMTDRIFQCHNRFIRNDN